MCEEFGSGSARQFWLRVPHEVQSDVSWDCGHPKTWQGLEGPSVRWLSTQLASCLGHLVPLHVVSPGSCLRVVHSGWLPSEEAISGTEAEVQCLSCPKLQVTHWFCRGGHYKGMKIRMWGSMTAIWESGFLTIIRSLAFTLRWRTIRDLGKKSNMVWLVFYKDCSEYYIDSRLREAR